MRLIDYYFCFDILETFSKMHEMMVTNFQSMAKNQSILVGYHLSFKMDSEVYVYKKNYSHFKQAEAMFS